MRRQIEGSRAIAEAIAACRPQVIPAYPITPQTHIVEALGAMAKAGTLTPCEFITVESEFAAMSAAIGASAAGARAYTATASQGLLYMAEALYNVSGLGLPVVMTVANRAIGAPINIWNDHSDSMSQRDCGWIQLYAEDNQAAVDLHVVAFRLAERLSVPVMVCVDGFVLTHAVEPIEVPSQELVDDYLPSYRPRQVLDPDEPVTIGAMVGPEAFTEVRVLAHLNQLRAVDDLRELADEYAAVSGRTLEAVSSYRTDGADTVLVTMGSVTGTARDLVDELAVEGEQVGVVSLSLYRPFPAADVRAALAGASRVIVVERAFAPGAGGVVSPDVLGALTGRSTQVDTVVAGLGGRAVTKAALRAMLADAAAGRLERFSFLELRHDVIERELARSAVQHTGVPTHHVLRATGVPAARIG
jgi:pyruvate ferredoxin oxidoreductase alpha subunit